jgi:hypothetical protein
MTSVLVTGGTGAEDQVEQAKRHDHDRVGAWGTLIAAGQNPRLTSGTPQVAFCLHAHSAVASTPPTGSLARSLTAAGLRPAESSGRSQSPDQKSM